MMSRRLVEAAFSVGMHTMGLGVVLGMLQGPRPDNEKVWLALIAVGVAVHALRSLHLIWGQDD